MHANSLWRSPPAPRPPQPAEPATSTEGSAERRTRKRAPRSGEQGEAGCGGRRDALSTFPAEIETKGKGWTCTLTDPKLQIPAASAAAGNAEAADGGCPNPKPITPLTENRHGRSAS